MKRSTDRLGHWTEDKTRLLLVKFKDYEQKEHVMSNLSNLRQPIDKFKGIGISHDLHSKEREEIKSMVEKAKQEHIANEVDDVGLDLFHATVIEMKPDIAGY